MDSTTGRQWFNYRWGEWYSFLASRKFSPQNQFPTSFLFVNLFLLSCSESEWSLHPQFTDIDLHLRLFTWHLYSHISSLGHSNYNSTMDARIWCCTNNGCRTHHRFESGLTKFHQICHFNWQHFSGSFPVGCRLHATFLSYACGSCSNNSSTTSSSSSQWYIIISNYYY